MFHLEACKIILVVIIIVTSTITIGYRRMDSTFCVFVLVCLWLFLLLLSLSSSFIPQSLSRSIFLSHASIFVQHHKFTSGMERKSINNTHSYTQTNKDT